MSRSEKLEQKRNLWKERIALFQESGQSVAKWCKEQELPEHQLRYWLRKAVAKQSTASGGITSRWVAMGSLEDNSSTGVSLRIGSVHLDVQRGFDPFVLTEVVRSLTGLC